MQSTVSRLPSAYSTAGFSIFPDSGRLVFGSEECALSLINMRVLSLMLESPGEVITRNSFFDRVWANQVVSDDALTRCISDIRQVLGRYTDETLIETLPKRGYRWLAGVTVGTAGLSAVQPARAHEPAEPAVPGQGLLAKLLLAGTGFVAALLLLLVAVALTGRDSGSEWTELALVPVQSQASADPAITGILQDSLRDSLLATDSLRFLSQQTLQEIDGLTYPALFREHDVAWIIETGIRETATGHVLTLGLVEARTSLVVYESRVETDGAPGQVRAFATAFTTAIDELIR